MKITNQQLKRIIKEELQKELSGKQTLNEQNLGNVIHRAIWGLKDLKQGLKFPSGKCQTNADCVKDPEGPWDDAIAGEERYCFAKQCYTLEDSSGAKLIKFLSVIVGNFAKDVAPVKKAAPSWGKDDPCIQKCKGEDDMRSCYRLCKKRAAKAGYSAAEIEDMFDD